MKKILSKIFKKGKKIKYTKEMQEQDLLWNQAKEDISIMHSLQENIINQAKKLGWTGFSVTYDYCCCGEYEVITDIFYNEQEYLDGLDNYESSGRCIGLIRILEQSLNNPKNIMI